MTAKKSKKDECFKQLDSLKEFRESLTPEKLRSLREAVLASIDERKAAQKKKDETPPSSLTGICVVCSGAVKGEYERRSIRDVHATYGGPPPALIWKFKGYHCEKCGLSYKFPPPKDMSVKQSAKTV